MTDLFGEPARTPAAPPPTPLADRMRPSALDEVLGQDHLLGAGKVLRVATERGELHSMILWGPPGSGKTTLARLMAHATGARFVAYRAREADLARWGVHPVAHLAELAALPAWLAAHFNGGGAA